jgi:hypothetical protein
MTPCWQQLSQGITICWVRSSSIRMRFALYLKEMVNWTVVAQSKSTNAGQRLKFLKSQCPFFQWSHICGFVLVASQSMSSFSAKMLYWAKVERVCPGSTVHVEERDILCACRLYKNLAVSANHILPVPGVSFVAAVTAGLNPCKTLGYERVHFRSSCAIARLQWAKGCSFKLDDLVQNLVALNNGSSFEERKLPHQ